MLPPAIPDPSIYPHVEEQRRWLSNLAASAELVVAGQAELGLFAIQLYAHTTSPICSKVIWSMIRVHLPVVTAKPI